VVKKITLGPSAPGFVTVQLSSDIPVIIGDFLGIHYRKTETNPAIPNSRGKDGVVSDDELFTTINLPLYDESITEGQDINIGPTGRMKSTFALSANFRGNPFTPSLSPPMTTASPSTLATTTSGPISGACKFSEMGTEYRGTLSQTWSGKSCQRWDSQSPWSHTPYKGSQFPEGSVSGANNYCRNPDNEQFGPWCFTTDPATRWEYCSVPFCDCKMTPLGKMYRGSLSTSVSGYTCQEWDRQIPNPHPVFKNEDFPDRTVKEAGNYCRNPTNEPGGPWCYIDDPKADTTSWEYCLLDYCDCKLDNIGSDYQGTISQTADGIQCQHWDSQTPHSHPVFDASQFPDSTVKEASNYCRNPTGIITGPWCYTMNPNVVSAVCDIPSCGVTIPTTPGPSTTPTTPQITTPKYGPQEECKYSHMGKEYMGSFSKTSSGLNCQRWDSQFPHNHNNNDPDKFPDATLGDAANYC
ncbi:unnamed protein product, partial [Owenia fusiformis]